MFANYIVRSALLSLVSENITIHEILFASCQSVESQLVLPYMIHKGKGLKKFPHHPERILCILQSATSSSRITPCFFHLHHTVLPYYCSFPLHITLIFFFLILSEFLGT